MSSESNRDRVAIVTGAAGEIGQAIAKRFAREGYQIAVTDLAYRQNELEKLAGEVRELGVKSVVVTGDITVEKDVEHIVQETVRNFGSLQVMVANAGKFIGHPITSLPVEDWSTLIDTNAKGTMLCYKVAANQMIKQQKEKSLENAHYRLIGVTSVASLTGAPLCAAYAASKFAARGLTQATASDLGPYNITVNACAPGFIESTPMLGGLISSVKDNFGVPPEAWHKVAVDSTKLKRLGDPKDIAACVSYFASIDAGWTTGQTLAVDGGMHLSN